MSAANLPLTYLIIPRMLTRTRQAWLSTGGSSGFRWLICHLSHEGEIVRNLGHQFLVFLLYSVKEFVQMAALNQINGKSLESERPHLFTALMVGQVL